MRNNKDYFRDKYIGRAQNLDLYGVTIANTRKDYLIDVEGNEYIDLFSAASSLPLGYERNDLIKAYTEQCKKVSHVCTVYTYTPVVEEYARRLCETSGLKDVKVLFGAFGSDSIDAALKCAQAYTGKKRFIGFKKGYHGSTFLSLASNGFDGLKTNLYLPDLFTHLQYPTKEYYQKTLADIEMVLKKGETSALIMETILGDGGVLSPHPEFYEKIKPLLYAYKAILILDEIQTGVGRTGKFWGFQQFNIQPDLFCTAKGLGGGYATLSACIGRAEVIDSLMNCQNAFTLCAHAGSCAVGLRVIDAIYEEKAMENTQEISSLLKNFFEEKLSKSTIFDEVRGMGLMLGIALKGKQSMGPCVGRLCLKEGVYVGYYGEHNNVIRIQPALNIEEKSALKGAKRVVRAIETFEHNMEKYLKSELPPSFFTS